MNARLTLFGLVASICLPVSTSAQTSLKGLEQTRTLSMNIAPVIDSKVRARLWDAIEATGELTTVTVGAAQLPQDAITAKCGSAPVDLMRKVFSLNPGVDPGAVPFPRQLKTIPCPYWYFGNGKEKPSVQVRAGESINPIVKHYLGASGKPELARVAKLNPKLVDSQTGNVTSDGALVLPFVTKPLTLTVPSQVTPADAAVSVKAIADSLPAPARHFFNVALSPDEYQLVALDDPALADPTAACGGPKNETDWPFDLASLQTALAATQGLSGGKAQDNVVVIADTGVQLSDALVSERLWRNVPIASGLPGPVANYRNDLHGASMVTRKGDPVDIEPNSAFGLGGHGTDVAHVIVDPGVRATALDKQFQVAIAKLIEQSQPFKISIESVPAAINYARGIRASSINLSVVAGSIGTLEDSLDASAALVVTAAGNNAARPETLSVFPPALASHREKLLVVGAHDWTNRLAPFSNFGSNVDILAPGCAIPIRDSGTGKIRLVSGTSFATPFVTYTAALLHSVNMPLRPAVLRNRILSSGRFDPLLVNKTRYGVVLDIERTIRIAEDSYLPVGATIPVFGKIALGQNWTCGAGADTQNFVPAQVLKVIPSYPSATPSPMIWTHPASDGPLSERLCTGPLQVPTFDFIPNGQTDVQKIPWAAVQDVVMRVFPD